jgi:molybdenum cofactor guanylyltransferase
MPPDSPPSVEGSRPPIGVVLAGGLGLRIGGSKARVELAHRPLISYPLDAMYRALGQVAIVAKIDTELPDAPGARVWIEPDRPRHPLVGIIHALELAEGRAVVVCAADLPFVTPELIARLASADPGSGRAVLASSAGASQPLLACYQHSALERLAALELDDELSLRAAVAALDPVALEVSDPDELFNVNAPEDLLAAAAILDRRRATRT